MQLVTVAEAAKNLGLETERELLDLVLNRRIPKPQKVFGWTVEDFEKVQNNHGGKRP